MTQTTKYKLNLIEPKDTFSPDPLNDNMTRVDAALDAIRAEAAAGLSSETQARIAAVNAEAQTRANAINAEAQARANAVNAEIGRAACEQSACRCGTRRPGFGLRGTYGARGRMGQKKRRMGYCPSMPDVRLSEFQSNCCG